MAVNNVSYDNLTEAREKALHDQNYNYISVCADLCRKVREHFGGHTPYNWQLDIAKAIILSLNTIIIAPTGVGKTLPFVIPTLYSLEKITIIISPLIALQYDQVFEN